MLSPSLLVSLLCTAGAPEALSPEARQRYEDAVAKQKANDYSAATTALNALATEFPRVPEVFVTRCYAQLGLKRWSTAEADCQYALKLSRLASAVYGLAVAEEGLKRYAAAVGHYNEYASAPGATGELTEAARARVKVLEPVVAAAAAPRPPPCDQIAGGDDDEGVYLSPKIVDACGTAYFKGDPDDVFVAAAEAAKTLGFGVAAAHSDRGLLITDLFTIDATAIHNGYAASVIDSQRQYEVRFEPAGDGYIKVRAEPRAYENHNDVSARKIWRLEGQWGEKPRWRRLFARMRDLMPTAPKPHTDPNVTKL